jgi:hypothetical protein
VCAFADPALLPRCLLPRLHAAKRQEGVSQKETKE